MLPSQVPDTAWATYGGVSILPGGHNLVRWRDFYNRGKIWVKIRPEVLASDEAILAVFAHEMHELKALREIFANRGGVMRSGELFYLIHHVVGAVHQEAVEVGDEFVISLRNERLK